MLLPFLISQLLVLTIANPFHKYPYVFLLDVGNEEIEKTEAEQIRLTIPGGSMAVKYPATGDGDLIGHVRVSGIDFGTDLKASIVEGGPGYKYVVIVFSGNPGNTYDAVVTIQTIPNSEENDNSPTNSDNEEKDNSPINIDNEENDNLPINFDSEENDNSPTNSDNEENDNFPTNSDDEENDNTPTNSDNDNEDDNENSIENADDSSMTVYSENSEVMQSSSNIYKYAVNDVVDTKWYGDDESSNNSDGNDDGDDANEQNGDSNNKNNNNNNYVKDFSDDVSVIEKVSGKYTAFKPHFYGGIRFYPQAAVYTQGYASDDDTNIVNDENRSDKYRDTSNPDTDYASPVEY